MAFKLTKAQVKARDLVTSSATHTALGGGSRSGKTFFLVRMLLIRAITSAGSRHVVFRFRFNALKASIIGDTLPKVLSLCFPQLPPLNEMLNRTDWFMTLPNGSEVWFAGLDDKDRTEKILGMEFVTLYFNECSQIPWRSVELAHSRLAQLVAGRDGKPLKPRAYYDFNPPSKKHWTYVLFLDKKSPVTRAPVLNEFNYGFHLINPADNTENISPEYLNILNGMSERDRNRFLFGKFADDSEGQLWSEELLQQQRVLGQTGSVPEFVRVVIAVDPSGCQGSEDSRSDEVGIVVVKLGTNGRAYVIEDLSGRHSPEEWADVVNAAHSRHRADIIVGEANYGGDMVRAVLQAKNRALPYKTVTATRGKHVRAEPIATLYEQGYVHHIGYFPEIEDQLCGMTTSGYVGTRSPDRADAMIWALTELFPRIIKEAPSTGGEHGVMMNDTWRPPAVKRVARSLTRFDRGDY